MLLTITTTCSPATDLGFLLHKHPERVQTFPQTFGQAHVFYPEASQERCTAALLLDVDSVRLVRGPKSAASMEQYVNDRPYVASSFLSVALSNVFGTAMAGRCEARPELVATSLPLSATLSVIPSRRGDNLLNRLFEPLGYTVSAEQHPLDELYPDWGASPYYTFTLSAVCRLVDLLTHIYVLIPVLDHGKHYWIGKEEVEKLLRRGKGWLETHPERELIAYRYLYHKPVLAREALARLVVEEKEELMEEEETSSEEPAGDSEKHVSLHEQRLDAVVEVLRQAGARSVLDLGCGEGRLLRKLLRDGRFEKILGMDVSYRALELAQKRLHLDTFTGERKKRIDLLQGSLTYRDRRLEGFDAAAVVEVIEHLDQPRLAAFERTLFEFARPHTVVLTTPNREYNVKFATMPSGQMRHVDHRFEWTRQEFQGWAERVARRYNYTVHFLPLGPEDEAVGAPSQMGIFARG
ncbi:MAG TPA: 3' terminal RNA ribose 2'-O-methyltransferase Hen1 [Ktedonobacteraceae bacterium]|nr:3' terminal RNA ribose 2'-O-methyltransferase Hen1 [Ktedonobacteraceae bacterium]